MSYSALLLDDGLAHVSSEGQWLMPGTSPREPRHRPPSMLDSVLSWPERNLALAQPPQSPPCGASMSLPVKWGGQSRETLPHTGRLTPDEHW